jgi:3-deoxy-manno-octulosonate cytidylyltransferase (CMP-KDO synthetase)
MKIVKKLGIIPARFASTRFPGKPLVDIGGQTMIERVYGQAKKSNLDHVVVATDDDRIARAVSAFGGEAILTSVEAANGTDRCREALQKLAYQPDLVVNIQGDEPFIDPEQINKVLELLERDKVEIATLVSPAKTKQEIENPNRVKAVIAKNDRVLYFSRSALPYTRNESEFALENYRIHLGIYGFKGSILEQLAGLEQSALEKAESLEQLRWIENGFDIFALETNERADAVDTPEDLEALRQKFFL